jgi:hypothetical protein
VANQETEIDVSGIRCEGCEEHDRIIADNNGLEVASYMHYCQKEQVKLAIGLLQQPAVQTLLRPILRRLIAECDCLQLAANNMTVEITTDAEQLGEIHPSSDAVMAAKPEVTVEETSSDFFRRVMGSP